MDSKYLKNFFEEKVIEYEMFEIKGEDGFTHFICTDAVIQTILHTTTKEQAVIASTLRKLDFNNYSVKAYLKFLASCLVKSF